MCLPANLENLAFIPLVDLYPKLFTFKRLKIAGKGASNEMNLRYGTGEL
jgi:hypothetical protein